MNPRPIGDLHFSRVLAGNMRRLRRERGISQARLAGLIEADGHRMSTASISQFEYGVTRVPRSMTVDHLMWLAKALNAPLTALLAELEEGS